MTTNPAIVRQAVRRLFSATKQTRLALFNNSNSSLFQPAEPSFSSTMSRSSQLTAQQQSRFFSSNKSFDNTKAMQDFQRLSEQLNQEALESGNSERGFVDTAPVKNNIADAKNNIAEDPRDLTEGQRITSATIKEQNKVLFPRLTEAPETADLDDLLDNETGEDPIAEEKLVLKIREDGSSEVKPANEKKEYGFKYLGQEPTKFNDWAHKGRVTDF